MVRRGEPALRGLREKGCEPCSNFELAAAMVRQSFTKLVKFFRFRWNFRAEYYGNVKYSKINMEDHFL